MRVAFAVGSLGWLGALAVACGGASFSAISGDGGGGEGGTASSGGTGSGGGSGSGASGSGSSSGTTSGGGSNGGSGGGSSGTASSGSSGMSSGAGSASGGTSSGTTSSSSGGCVSCNDGGPAPVCPSAQPAADSACTSNGLECEYGMSPVQSCDSVATCTKFLWTVASPTGTGCSTPLGTGCPSTFAVAAPGGVCSDSGLVCDYPNGRCDCASSILAGAPIILIDGSLPADHWVCQDPTTLGCPFPRPALGKFCTPPGLECDYGSCYVEGGTTEVCQGGVWQSANVACPG